MTPIRDNPDYICIPVPDTFSCNSLYKAVHEAFFRGEMFLTSSGMEQKYYKAYAFLLTMESLKYDVEWDVLNNNVTVKKDDLKRWVEYGTNAHKKEAPENNHTKAALEIQHLAPLNERKITVADVIILILRHILHSVDMGTVSDISAYYNPTPR